MSWYSFDDDYDWDDRVSEDDLAEIRMATLEEENDRLSNEVILLKSSIKDLWESIATLSIEHYKLWRDKEWTAEYKRVNDSYD